MKMNVQKKKRQVLVFMLAPPLPAVAGGDIYAVNALIPFAADIDFHLFCYVGGEEDIRKVDRHRRAYDEVFRSVHLEQRPTMPFQMPRVRRAFTLAWQAIRGMPFIDASYYSHSAIASARRLVRKHRIDAMEINSAHLAFFKKFFPGIPAMLVGHNIESDIFPFWMPTGLRGWKLRFMEWVAQCSRRAAHAVEIENSLGFEVMTFISSRDMSRVTAGAPKLLMPLSFARRERKREGRNGGTFNVLWMGGFGWYPNAEGVTWFAREIFPLLGEKLKRNNIVLHFCGSNPPEELRALHDGVNVLVHGFVEDINAMLDQAHLLMVPLLSGAGIRVKIIEAMSAGLPVLSTSKGCEGVGAEDGLNIIIRDEAAEFAKAIIQASHEPERLENLSREALQLMEDQYSIEASLRAKRMAYGYVGVPHD